MNELLVLITEFAVDSFPFCALGLLYLLAFLFLCFLAQFLYLTVSPPFDFIYIINYRVHVWNICIFHAGTHACTYLSLGAEVAVDSGDPNS